VQNVLSQQPITSDENIVINYLCDSKIGNITKGTEVIINGYDDSLITFETFLINGCCGPVEKPYQNPAYLKRMF